MDWLWFWFARLRVKPVTIPLEKRGADWVFLAAAILAIFRGEKETQNKRGAEIAVRKGYYI
jgi:hypothetical protein